MPRLHPRHEREALSTEQKSPLTVGQGTFFIVCGGSGVERHLIQLIFAEAGVCRGELARLFERAALAAVARHDLQRLLGRDLGLGALGRAAQKGFDGQTCSFLRMLEGMELEKPDYVVSTMQPCQQAERVFADLVRELDIPDRLYSLQTPINGHSRNAVEMMADGLAESVSLMEKAFGRKLDPARLEEACRLSNEAAALAKKCAHLRFTSPPLVRGSEAIYNAVVFSQLWGTQDLVDIQQAYYEELLAKKEWAEKRYALGDTHRLLWLHLPPFYDSKHLDFVEKTCNAPIVFEETNFVAWEPLDPKDPYRSLAKKLLQSGFLDPSLRVEYVKKAIPAGQFNGVILYTHGFGRCSLADRAFSKQLRETLDAVGVPLLALEGDCMDASIDPCSTVTKIASFVEALNFKRYGNIFGIGGKKAGA